MFGKERRSKGEVTSAMENPSAGGGSGFDDQRQDQTECLASDFYQFSENPFEDNPDPKFLYLTRSYEERIASILTWIKKGNGFAVITGEAGTGKTFFIRALVSRLDENVIPLLVQNPVATIKELIETILSILEQPIRAESEPVLIHRFTELLDQMIDKTLLIILDEAQGLNDRILDEIERFFDLRSKLIRIIFVGQPHLDERLHSMRLGQKIETNQKIRPFSEEESRKYMEHRLRLVGSSSGIMTPRAISMICSYSQGVPSLINHICNNALWVGSGLNRKKIDVDIIDKIIRNLEGPRTIRKIIPSIQLTRIWKPAIQVANSLKNALMAAFLRMTRNFEGPMVIRKIIPSVRLRWIRKGTVRQNLDLQVIPKIFALIEMRHVFRSLIRFAISFKRILMIIYLKASHHQLQGRWTIPKILSSFQLRQIWKSVFKSSTKFVVSFKKVIMVIFLKFKNQLQRRWIIPKILPSVQLRQIWKPVFKSPIKFPISFKRFLMIIFLKARHNLQLQSIVLKTTLSRIQFRRIWKTAFESHIKFFISLKRILMVIFFKVRHNLQWTWIIPKNLSSFQLRQIWKPNTHLGISLKRRVTTVFIIFRRNLELVRIIPKVFPSIQLRRIWKSSMQFSLPLKNISVAIFALASLGGVIFLLYEEIGQPPVKIPLTNSLTEKKRVIDSSANKSSVQPSKEGISEKAEIPKSDEKISKKAGNPKSDQPKLTQRKSSSFRQDTLLFRPKKGKQKIIKAAAGDKFNVAFPRREKKLSPPELKTDYIKEAPKPPLELPKALKTEALTLVHFFAADQGPYGCIWKIYIDAEDPEGDMDRISVEVDQVNYGHYPTEWIMIKPEHRKHLKGFLQWNTFSSKASYLPEGTQISVRISIFDQAGNKSNELRIPFTFNSGVIKKYRIPAPFDEWNIPRIGYVMVELCQV